MLYYFIPSVYVNQLTTEKLFDTVQVYIELEDRERE